MSISNLFINIMIIYGPQNTFIAKKRKYAHTSKERVSYALKNFIFRKFVTNLVLF